MRWRDITEGYLTLPHGQHVMVVKNPAPRTVIAMLKRSRSAHLRGLVMGRDCYWWDGHDAIHGDIAHVLGHDEYVDDRQEMRLRGGGVMCDFDFANYQQCIGNIGMQRLFKSPDILFYAGSEGWLPGPEFVAAIQAEAA